MAPSKLPVMQSLSSQFLRFGFNLEGVARCLHTTNWVCRDVDGTSAANNLHNSVIAECGDRFCSRDHSHQVKAFYVAAANGAALARGGNGPAGISTLSTHNLQFPSSIVQARASCSGSLRLILPPAFRSLRPHCNGSTFSYGVFVRGVRTLAADIKPGNVVELKGKLQEVVKTVWTMQVCKIEQAIHSI